MEWDKSRSNLSLNYSWKFHVLWFFFIFHFLQVYSHPSVFLFLHFFAKFRESVPIFLNNLNHNEWELTKFSNPHISMKIFKLLIHNAAYVIHSSIKFITKFSKSNIESHHIMTIMDFPICIAVTISLLHNRIRC